MSSNKLALITQLFLCFFQIIDTLSLMSAISTWLLSPLKLFAWIIFFANIKCFEFSDNKRRQYRPMYPKLVWLLWFIWFVSVEVRLFRKEGFRDLNMSISYIASRGDWKIKLKHCEGSSFPLVSSSWVAGNCIKWRIRPQKFCSRFVVQKKLIQATKLIKYKRQDTILRWLFCLITIHHLFLQMSDVAFIKSISVRQKTDFLLFVHEHFASPQSDTQEHRHMSDKLDEWSIILPGWIYFGPIWLNCVIRRA